TVSLGFSFNATNTGGIDVRTRPGDAEGSFNAHDMAITGSVGLSLAEGFSLGVSGKFLYEKIYVDESSGYAFDFGGMYKISPDLTVGVSVDNLGSMNEMRTEAIELPALLRAGASYTGLLTDRFSYRVSGDYVTIFKQSDSHLHLGGELAFDNTLALRAGYQTGYEAKSISGGLGIIYGKVRFDYAFVPFTSGFGSTHTFSLSFRI
ncbi:MAG TPA: PorV/PorQ family protein, partial [Bacteroidota bacterium]|nr:PorV/PorQ family protein [Bacteroidota bacterium]